MRSGSEGAALRCRRVSQLCCPSVRPSARPSAPPPRRAALRPLRVIPCRASAAAAASERGALRLLHARLFPPFSLFLSRKLQLEAFAGVVARKSFPLSLSLSFFFAFVLLFLTLHGAFPLGFLVQSAERRERFIGGRRREKRPKTKKKKKKSNQSRYIATKITTIIKKKGGEREKKKTTTNKPSTPQLRQEDEKYFKAFIQQESLKALQSFIALLTSPSKWQMDTAAGPMGGSLPANISIEQGNFWELSIRAPSADCQLGAP